MRGKGTLERKLLQVRQEIPKTRSLLYCDTYHLRIQVTAYLSISTGRSSSHLPVKQTSGHMFTQLYSTLLITQCLCVYVCVVVMWVHICAHPCGSQKSTSDLLLMQHPKIGQVLSQDWNSASRLGWLVGEPQAPTSLHSPSTGVTSRWHHAWLLVWVLGIKLIIWK